MGVAVNGNVTLHPINKLDASKIVDTNGAGDAFVCGFLAALSKGKSVADCCLAGNYFASIILDALTQRSPSTLFDRRICTVPAVLPSFVFGYSFLLSLSPSIDSSCPRSRTVKS